MTAKERPSRVVAYVGAAAALWDFGVRPVGVFGPAEKSDGSALPQAGNLDLSKVTSVGDVWGEFNLERYAALRPDLLVTIGMSDEVELWSVPDESVDQVEQVAPTLIVNGTRVDLREPIRMFGRLAESLGADLERAGVPAAERRFEQATERLTEQARTGASGPKVLAVAGGQDGLYVALPDDHTDLTYFAEHGLDLVVPDRPGKAGFWERLSWENADRYDADLVLWDSRAGNLTPKQFAEQPVWKRLPMAKPERMLPWRVEAPLSYQQYATLLEELADGLETARANIAESGAG